jgi:hypothetical protein
MYKYGTLKLVEVILRMDGGKRENNGGDQQAGVHCMQIWNSHNKPSVLLSYTKKCLKRATIHGIFTVC